MELAPKRAGFAPERIKPDHGTSRQELRRARQNCRMPDARRATWPRRLLQVAGPDGSRAPQAALGRHHLPAVFDDQSRGSRRSR